MFMLYFQTGLLLICGYGTVKEGLKLLEPHMILFIYLLGVLCCFQHCTGHITTGSFVGRENHYIQLVKVLLTVNY